MVEARTAKCHTEPCEHGVVLTIEGEIDFSSSPSLRQSVQVALKNRPAKFIINLAGVPYMDSSGVAVLVEALQTQMRNKAQLVVCALQPKVRGIFEIARLDMVFKIAADLDAAKAM
ncbi:MAG: STAS domain-containing protein [Phycisphaeraceae bacterium]|nr:STAS domain-containing protein [Phycisphaeraceae bacterium]